jgi:hypothetical protein
MTISKEFLKLQDLILANTSISKVLLHLDERKEKAIMSWIKRELSEFFKKFENDPDLRDIVVELKLAIEMENIEKIDDLLMKANKILEDKITFLYFELMRDQSKLL